MGSRLSSLRLRAHLLHRQRVAALYSAVFQHGGLEGVWDDVLLLLSARSGRAGGVGLPEDGGSFTPLSRRREGRPAAAGGSSSPRSDPDLSILFVNHACSCTGYIKIFFSCSVVAPPAGVDESFQRAKLLPLQLLTECSLSVATFVLPYFLLVRPEDSSALASASSLSLSVPAMLLPFIWPGTGWVEVYVPLQVAWLQVGAVLVTAVTIAGFLAGRLELLAVRGTGKGGNKAGLMQWMGLDIDVDAHLVRRLLWSAAGWLWVVAGSLLTAPLFSIPTLSACSEFYPRSYFFGAVVETAATCIRINSPGLV